VHKIKRSKRISAEYEKEPGVLRSYKKSESRSYARIREAFTGRELWRCRYINNAITFDMHACAFGTIDEFIEWVKNEQD